MRRLAAFALMLAIAGHARAGLYYSGEPFADLPSQWRGFLLDWRMLRGIALKPGPKAPVGPARQRYQEEAGRLTQTAKQRALTADESADLGALHVRLGNIDQALAVLRAAFREHPKHFRLAANLGTAWQLQGDYDQAAACLQQAVRLAPGKLQAAEEYHLKLVRLRQRRPRGTSELDDLFGVRYVGESGRFEPGKLAAAERKKLPSAAAAVAQQLALWLPGDPLLLWQLAELANAYGDVRTAAAMYEGCVSEFGLAHPELRRRRQEARAAADRLGPNVAAGDPSAHEGGHAGTLPARSKRPLAARLDATPLPAVRADGTNPVPWHVMADTTLDREHRPTFHKYLRELDGKRVELSGYMQPLGEDLETASFMLIEYPVGCWYCEMPTVTGIVLVDLPDGKTTNVTRGRVKVVGKLTLNATDPENFLYTVADAKVISED